MVQRAVMLSLIIPGVMTATLGIVQMLPTVRRRAAERGFSGSIVIPALIACIGLALLSVGFLMGE